MTHDCDIRANVEKFKCGVMSGEFLLKSVSVYFIIHLFIMRLLDRINLKKPNFQGLFHSRFSNHTY